MNRIKTENVQVDNRFIKIDNEKVLNKLNVLKARIANGETIPFLERIQVAVLADSPTVVTGFGNVCREILSMLQATGLYSFHVVGINHDGSPHDFPYRIYPAVNPLMQDAAYRDVYGRQKFLDILGEGYIDIVWCLQDTFIMNDLGKQIFKANEVLPADKKFAFVYYFPIDATPKKFWLDGCLLTSDFPVVYTKYGYNEIIKCYSTDENTKLKPEEVEQHKKELAEVERKLNIIYHGVNLADFKPLTDEQRMDERAKFWNDKKDKFVFINVNRNQPRKDLFRTLQAFKILLDRRRAKGKDDVYLYMHCNIFDTGLNLIDMSKQLDLVEGDEWAFPDPHKFSTSKGFPVDMINKLYGASDAVVTTTLGEGWGLSITEAMATRRIILAPDQTSLTEMLGKNNSGSAERGILIKTKGEFVQHDDNSRVRPLTDVEDLATQMEWVMEHPEEVKAITDRAFQWVNELNWGGEVVGSKWKKLFESAWDVVAQKRSLAIDEVVKNQLNSSLGRNDICPVCNTKLKHCRHAKQ